MRFVHAADLHIDSARGAPIPEQRVATREAFSNLINLCVEENVDLLLLAGDVFDGDLNDHNSGEFFVRQLGRLRARADGGATRVVLVQGNHDAQNVITRELRLPEHVTKLSAQAPESVLFEDLGVVVHGQSFKSRAVTDNLALDYPPPVEHLFNIGLLHCNVGAVAGHDNYAPCTCDQLASHGYQYWALGHVHNRAVLHENPWVVYPGNLQARHIRETGKKGAYLVQVEDGDLVHMAFRPLDVVRWEHLIVDASHMTDRDELLNAIQSAVASANSDADGLPLIVRVTLTGATELHNGLTADLATWEEEIREWVAQMGQVWTEKVKIKTSACDSSAGSILDPEFLGALKERLNALAQDDDAIAQLSQSVSALSQKTAQHLETRASDSGYMRELLGRVGGILEGRLGAQWAGDE